MSYGPCSVPKTLVIGFLLGCTAFVLREALRSGPAYDTANQMQSWLGAVGVAVMLCLAVSAVVNYVIGRRVEAQVMFSRKNLLSNRNLSEPTPKSDASGFTLRAETRGEPRLGTRAPTRIVEHARAREHVLDQRRVPEQRKVRRA